MIEKNSILSDQIEIKNKNIEQLSMEKEQLEFRLQNMASINDTQNITTLNNASMSNITNFEPIYDSLSTNYDDCCNASKDGDDNDYETSSTTSRNSLSPD
jgi:hypothetical protein